MAGLGGMHEEGRCAGGGQRRGDLAADMAALAHAHDDDPAAAFEHRLNAARETFALARGQRLQRLRLDLEGPLRQLQGALRVEAAFAVHVDRLR